MNANIIGLEWNEKEYEPSSTIEEGTFVFRCIGTSVAPIDSEESDKLVYTMIPFAEIKEGDVLATHGEEGREVLCLRKK
jgi:hypothetical protein